jgi:acyl-CoA thioester hydrolase
MEASTTPEARVRIAIRRRDIDTLGHLNQAVYHELLEEGRMVMVEQLGVLGEDFVLARVELDYRHEVRLADGTIDVVTRPGRVGRSSVVFEHQILLPDGSVAAEGRSIVVAWDPAARGSRALTDEERDRLQGVPAAGR